MPSVLGDPDSEKVCLPLVYALLSSKEKIQYKAVFQAIKSAADEYNIQNLKPPSMMSDFEVGVINAVTEEFEDCDLRLCFFHLKQTLYRKIQEFGLQRAYNDPNDDTIRQYTHMLAALTYVPVHDVVNVFRELKEDAPEEMAQLFKYFEENYVSGIRGAGRRRAVPPR